MEKSPNFTGPERARKTKGKRQKDKSVFRTFHGRRQGGAPKRVHNEKNVKPKNRKRKKMSYIMLNINIKCLMLTKRIITVLCSSLLFRWMDLERDGRNANFS